MLDEEGEEYTQYIYIYISVHTSLYHILVSLYIILIFILES